MYTFVKVINTYKDLNIEYPWLFVAKSASDIIEHSNRYLKTVIEDGVVDAFVHHNKHPRTPWRNTVDALSSVKQMSWIDTSVYLEGTIFSGKIKSLQEFGSIYLRNNGVYMVPSEYTKVVDTKDKEDMIYPTMSFTEKDIRITRWPNGKHYYAKVGNLDVRESDGTSKWNTYGRAHEVACEFIKKSV